MPARLTLEEFSHLARSRGGICLSDHYINSKTSLLWRCSEGHECGVPFLKTRPKWLINSRGNRMELDGYAESLQVAFEYQGVQHYQREYLHKQTPKWLHRTPEEFAWQQQKDAEKRILCKAHSITLIEVPWWWTKDLEGFISAQLVLLGLQPIAKAS